MNEKVFVDTDVLVYARDATEPQKQLRALEWMENLWRTRRGTISFQVLQEFYVTVTTKLDPGMEVPLARSDVRNLIAWGPVSIDAAILEGAWSLQDRYSVSWWDSLIVATALRARCRFMISEDLQDGQKLDDLTVVNPFVHAPREILNPV